MMNKGDRKHKFIMFVLNIKKAAALREKKKALEERRALEEELCELLENAGMKNMAELSAKKCNELYREELLTELEILELEKAQTEFMLEMATAD
jgi:hypothetical protein